MTRIVRILAASAALAFGTVFLMPKPVVADGAASTRNIIFGAAAVAGTLLIINHNKKVHEKYAEYDRRQAYLQAENANMAAAYNSERQAYLHEAALVGEYKKEVAAYKREVAYQHTVIQQLRGSHSTGFIQTTPPSAARSAATRPQVVSYGWGSF